MHPTGCNATAYYLSRHPRFSPSTHTLTIVEGASIASAASGKAGGLLALDWHGAPTASISELSFGLHEKLALEHGGKDKWGYRRLDVVSLQADLSRRSKGNKGGKGTTGHKGLHGWLGKELMDGVRVRELGNVRN
jgi:glycine/D-amino acid oxidase-like deaminating enzyme